MKNLKNLDCTAAHIKIFMTVDCLSSLCRSEPFSVLSRPPSEDPGHSEHSGAEEAADGPGHLHEDSGLFLHRHLLRSIIQRGNRVLMTYTCGDVRMQTTSCSSDVQDFLSGKCVTSCLGCVLLLPCPHLSLRIYLLPGRRVDLHGADGHVPRQVLQAGDREGHEHPRGHPGKDRRLSGSTSNSSYT